MVWGAYDYSNWKWLVKGYGSKAEYLHYGHVYVGLHLGTQKKDYWENTKHKEKYPEGLWAKNVSTDTNLADIFLLLIFILTKVN